MTVLVESGFHSLLEGMIAGMIKSLTHYLQRVEEEEEGRESRGVAWELCV